MSDRELKRSVHLIDLVMLGAGTAIGAAIFSVLGPAAKLGGSGLVVSLAIAAVPMLIFGIVYAFLASALPRSGASYEWQRAFIHPLAAFLVVWLRVMGSAVLMVTMAQVLVNYLSMAIDPPRLAVILPVFAAIFAANYFGIQIAARAQTVLMIVLLAIFSAFVVMSWPMIDPDRIGDPFSGGWRPILAALPLLINLYLGIETATEVGEEVRRAEINVPIGLALALALTALVYGAVATVSLGLVGADALAQSRAPLLEAAALPFGAWAKPVIVTAAALALVKSMNAIFLVYSRFLFAMGRAGVLPTALGRIHPVWGTPHVAITVAFAASVLAVLLPTDLIFLFLAINIPVMMKYFGTSLAAFNVAARHPAVFAQARLKLPKGLVRFAGAAGMTAALAIAAIGFDTNWRPYALFAGWIALGLIVLGRRVNAAPRSIPEYPR